MALHGPHHVAQKSIATMSPELIYTSNAFINGEHQTAIVDSGPTHKLFELGMRIDDFDHHIDVWIDEC